MNIQYLSDNFGNKTAVVIPINEWEIITEKHKDLENEILLNTIPNWHKKIIDSRLKSYKENPENVTDFDAFCEELEKELS
jgi:hypothetical protein